MDLFKILQDIYRDIHKMIGRGRRPLGVWEAWFWSVCDDMINSLKNFTDKK